MRYKHAVVTCVRWDAARIAEWLSYYQSIGYDHAYLYCNDDDPTEFVGAILPFLSGKNPFATYYHCRALGMQRWTYLHCLEAHGDEFEWISMFDADEFLSLRNAPDVDTFVSSYPDDTDSLYLNWTFFGHAGFATRPAGSVLLNYRYRQDGLDAHTKTMTRRSAINPELIRAKAFRQPEFVRFYHGWDQRLAPEMRRINVLGDDMADYYDRFAEAPQYLKQRTSAMLETAVLHHYAFQSEADFQRRIMRGTRGDHSGQTSWQKMAEAHERARFLGTINAVEDTTLSTYWENYLVRTAASAMIPSVVGLNVALGKACRQSSVASASEESAGSAVSGAVDARAAFVTDEQDAPWWEVDLGARHAIDAILLFNRLDQHMERSANLQIWLSDGDDVWRHVYRKEDGRSFGGVDGRPLVWRPPSRVIARLVRISLLGRSQLHLNQVEIYGAAAD